MTALNDGHLYASTEWIASYRKVLVKSFTNGNDTWENDETSAEKFAETPQPASRLLSQPTN